MRRFNESMTGGASLRRWAFVAALVASLASCDDPAVQPRDTGEEGAHAVSMPPTYGLVMSPSELAASLPAEIDVPDDDGSDTGSDTGA